MNQNSTTKTNQENNNGYEGVFTRARAHAHSCAPIYAYTHANPKSHSRISLFPLLMAFAVVMIVGVGNVYGQVEFTSSTTYNTPTGYYISKIEAWGAGGAGVRYNSSNRGGGGGGGGGYACGNVYLPQGASVTVHVAQQNTTAGATGDSSYVSYANNTFLLSAYGGGGASNYTAGKGAGQATNTVAGNWFGASVYKNGNLVRNKGGNGADGYRTGKGTFLSPFNTLVLVLTLVFFLIHGAPNNITFSVSYLDA